MNRVLAGLVGVIVAAASGFGCSHEPRLVARTYGLPHGDASWEAVSMALADEWQRHDVMSHAERRHAVAVVNTTARGHDKIAHALATR